MLTEIVKLCHETGCHLQLSRVDRRRRPDSQRRATGTSRIRQSERNHPSDAGPATEMSIQLRHLQNNFSQNLDDAENILNWARSDKLDIVFNMVRFTDPMLGNSELA